MGTPLVLSDAKIFFLTKKKKRREYFYTKNNMLVVPLIKISNQFIGDVRRLNGLGNFI